MATIIFSIEGPGVTVQEQHLLEGGGNEFQVPVGKSYFGKGSLCYTRL